MDTFLQSFDQMSFWGRAAVIGSAIPILLGFYGILWGIGTRRKMQRVMGHEAFRECSRFTRKTGRLAPRIRRMALGKWGSLLVGVALFVWQWPDISVPIAWPIAGAAIMTSLLQIARQSLPGTILVLGSGERSIDLHSDMIGNGGAFPMRTISLLWTKNVRINLRIAGECFRLECAENWEEIAFGFADRAAVVVMDCRQPTAHVLKECKYVLENLAYKTVFVLPDDDAETADHDCGSMIRQSNQKILVLKDVEAVPRLIGYLLCFLEVCPSEDQTIVQAYEPFQQSEQKKRHKRERENIPLQSQMPYGWAISQLPDPQNPQAIDFYTKASQAEAGGNHWKLLILLGMFETPWRRMRELQKIALALHRKATETEPDCPKLFTAFGIALARNQYWEEALEVFQKAETLAPENAWVEVNMGNCYAELGLREEAEKYWKLAESRSR